MNNERSGLSKKQKRISAKHKVSSAAKELGRKGGKARAANLSAKARSAAARKAALARWSKAKANGDKCLLN